MAKRKKYELKKSAKVMLCLIFAGLSAGMLYSSAQELQTMLQLKESIANDQNDIADLKQQESDLSEEKTKLEDPEYLKYMVRGKYLVSKDGEQVFKLPSSDSDTDTQGSE